VITNPSAELNPEGSGGVINLITKKSRGAGFTSSAYATGGSAGLKRLGASFGYNSKTLNVTGSVSGNYQRNKGQTHDLRVAIDPITGAERPSVFDIVGSNLARTPQGRLNVTYSLDPKTQLTGSANYSELFLIGHPTNRFEDFDENLQTVSLLARQGYRRLLVIDQSFTGGWRHTLGDKHELALDLIRNESRIRDHTNWLTGQQLPIAGLPLEQTLDEGDVGHSEAKLAYSRPMPDGATLKAGYELKGDDSSYNYRAFRGTSLENLLPELFRSNRFDFDQTINTGYATYERPFGDLSVQLGVRLEQVRWTIDQLTSGERVGQEYFRAYPSLHLDYKLDDERKLSASYSHRIQRPPPVLLNPRRYQVDPRNFQQGNPDLKPQDTESFELGYEQRHKGNYYLATLYYRNNSGEFSPVLRDLGGGGFLFTFDNVGSSKSAGLELVANGRLASTLTYNASANLYWSEVDAGNIADGGARSAFGASGRANLNWQVRPDDLVQVNAFVQGKRLLAQGYNEPVFTLNLGWRHKIDDRVTATLTVQDLLATNKFKRKLDSPRIRERIVSDPVSRAFILRLDYRFGAPGRPAREPGFEYENAAPAAAPGP
jgi:outer membrane receptor protein involved in Fe transport